MDAGTGMKVPTRVGGRESQKPSHRPARGKGRGCLECRRTAEGVVAHGDVDLHTASEFEEQVSEAVMLSTAGTFLVDLSGVTFLDSAGLQALIRVLELRDGHRMIVQPSRQVFTLLHLCGLTGALPNVLVREPDLGFSQPRGDLSLPVARTDPSGSSL